MPRIVNRPHVLGAVELSTREYDELQRVLRDLCNSPRPASRALARQINNAISEDARQWLKRTIWANHNHRKGTPPCG